MTDRAAGILAMIGACTIWGLSPLYYKLLSDVPPLEVLAHRGIWSLVFFGGVLAFQGRLAQMAKALRSPRRTLLIALAAAMISINWFLFIFSVQIGHTTEASLGYYIYPLVAVLIGRFGFSERLGAAQWGAVALAAVAVALLTWGLGVAPWISLALAATFGLYGAIKKGLDLGPVVSVACEVLLFLPVALAVLAFGLGGAEGAFRQGAWTAGLLILSGPLTATPLLLFSMAARRIPMATVGLLQYLNPTLQFLCAVAIFGERFTGWHAAAFGLIWTALALYSASTMRAGRAARRAEMTPPGVSATVRKPASEGAAKP